MLSMTLEQLRAAANAGGVVGVTLKAQGGGFFMEIATRSGQGAILSKARSTDPRRFGSPSSALVVLRDIGIAVDQLEPRPEGSHTEPGKPRPGDARSTRSRRL
jgi:hypothetical protein